ncbi:2140_t:CDS:1, partial [Cetraspora pellucida]
MSLYKAEESEFSNRYLCNTPLTKIRQNNIQPINHINEIQPDLPHINQHQHLLHCRQNFQSDSNNQNHIDNDLSIEQLINAFTQLNINENSSNYVIENNNNQNHKDFNNDHIHQNHSRQEIVNPN